MQLVNIQEIRNNENNPRIIKDYKFKQLVKSIKEFPEMLKLRPIVVNSEMIVLGGNMRLKACKEAGLKEVWVLKADELTEEQQREFIVKDNVGFGEWDWDVLANEWNNQQLEDWGLDLLPFEEEDVLEAEEDDFDTTPPEIAKTVLGDLYEIGEHRLLCGDSTDSDQVAKLMNGENAELLFTSPPYSDMREYNGSKDLSVSNIVEFITSFYQYCEYQVINLGIQRKEGEIFEYWNNYINKAKDNGYKFLSWNIWNRENAGFSIANITSMFATQHEWIFVFGKKVKKLNLTIENKEAGNTRNEVANRQKDGSVKSKKAPIIRDKRQLGTINTINPQLARDENIKHPAMFPVELPSEYIKAMSNEKDIIVEPFTGSGTTMVASHQLKRKCYGMELDPKYCDVIVKRMIKLDDTLTIKRNGIDCTNEWK
jgi:DNA modification methylase